MARVRLGLGLWVNASLSVKGFLLMYNLRDFLLYRPVVLERIASVNYNRPA